MVQGKVILIKAQPLAWHPLPKTSPQLFLLIICGQKSDPDVLTPYMASSSISLSPSISGLKGRFLKTSMPAPPPSVQCNPLSRWHLGSCSHRPPKGSLHHQTEPIIPLSSNSSPHSTGYSVPNANLQLCSLGFQDTVSVFFSFLSEPHKHLPSTPLC